MRRERTVMDEPHVVKRVFVPEDPPNGRAHHIALKVKRVPGSVRIYIEYESERANNRPFGDRDDMNLTWAEWDDLVAMLSKERGSHPRSA
jgi:hypothetical protein